MHSRKKSLYIVLCVICVLSSIAALTYPLAANLLSMRNRSIVQTQYVEAVNNTDEEVLQAAWKAAEEYNKVLSPVQFQDNAPTTLQSYNQLLNINGDGIMGYVDIPCINVYLPIYHGTDGDTLQGGIGHLASSSLPVGGLGTHAVLTGHTGLASNKLFSDIEEMQIGDVFYLHVLSRTLAYKVAEINVVEPDDTSHLTINKERDSCTLITCTPYGVNTHRLLVRGERIEYDGNATSIAEQVQVQAKQERFQSALFVFLPMTVLLVIVLIVMVRRKRKKKDNA